MTGPSETDVERPDSRIEHVIVLMLENRSFDHLLGYLDHPCPSYPSLIGTPRGIPVDPADPDGPQVFTTPSAHPALGADPDHSPEAVRLQIFGAVNPAPNAPITMNGFVRSYALKIADDSPGWKHPVLSALRKAWHWIQRLWRPPSAALAVPPVGADIMRCFTEQTAPVLSRLAKHYAVLVNWYSSVPGETWPNRNFAHAATSHGTTKIEFGFYRDVTIFDRLGPEGWRVYHEGVPQVWAFPSLWKTAVNRANFRPTDLLFTDIANKDLPKYTFVEPDHGLGPGDGNSQHPGNNTTDGDSFIAGEALIARIYHALADDPEFFATTMFLVTYDEHGGFYDHKNPIAVVAPQDGAPDKGFDFTSSGVRVPAVLISPLIAEGTVNPTYFDHASIPATIRRLFGTGTSLTKRDEAAASLFKGLSLLDTPREDRLVFPLTASPGQAESVQAKQLNDFQASLADLAGAVHTTMFAGAGEAYMAEDSSLEVPYKPEPGLAAAARTNQMDPATAQTMTEVLAQFGQPSAISSEPDATDLELS